MLLSTGAASTTASLGSTWCGSGTAAPPTLSTPASTTPPSASLNQGCTLLLADLGSAIAAAMGDPSSIVGASSGASCADATIIPTSMPMILAAAPTTAASVLAAVPTSAAAAVVAALRPERPHLLPLASHQAAAGVPTQQTLDGHEAVGHHRARQPEAQGGLPVAVPALAGTFAQAAGAGPEYGWLQAVSLAGAAPGALNRLAAPALAGECACGRS